MKRKAPMMKRKWCKHEKTKSYYDTYGYPSTEGVMCRLCGACHVERSWTDHEN